jgi:hypothetical protein
MHVITLFDLVEEWNDMTPTGIPEIGVKLENWAFDHRGKMPKSHTVNLLLAAAYMQQYTGNKAEYKLRTTDGYSAMGWWLEHQGGLPVGTDEVEDRDVPDKITLAGPGFEYGITCCNLLF